jgi:hypothetical protein
MRENRCGMLFPSTVCCPLVPFNSLSVPGLRCRSEAAELTGPNAVALRPWRRGNLVRAVGHLRIFVMPIVFAALRLMDQIASRLCPTPRTEALNS